MKQRDWYDIELEQDVAHREYMSNLTPDEKKERQRLVAQLTEPNPQYKMNEPLSTSVLSDLVSKRDNEITLLRELISCIRESFVVGKCKCGEAKHGMTCDSCFYIHLLDKGLAGVEGALR